MSERTQRFLITGAAGYIGSRLYDRLTPSQAVATYHRRPVAGGVLFDGSSMRLADDLLPRYPDLTYAFLLHGIGKLEDCARRPGETASVNVDGMTRMIDDLTARGIKVLFPSSDAVFDGTRGSWTEEEPAHPMLAYGRHKAAVEQHLQQKSPPWIVARLSKVVGPGDGGHSLFGEWIRQIDAGEPIRCADDLVFTPIHVDDVVTAFAELTVGPHSGIFNVCGPRSMTRYELLQMFLDAVRRFREVRSEVIACSIRDFPSSELRPLNQAMVPGKTCRTLGREWETMESLCTRIATAVYGPVRNGVTL